MQDVAYILRFFRVVSPIPPLMTGTFGVVSAVAATAVMFDPARASGAIAPVLLLQLFAASSGFGAPARRGHYDLLLTRGVGRTGVALAHWTVSIAPGVASWIGIAVVEFVASRGHRVALLASGTWAAVGLVSTLPWALNVALPRFASGIGWLLVLVTATTTFSRPVIGEWTVGSTQVEALVWPAWVFLISPLGAVGRSLGWSEMLAVAPALTIAVGAMVIASRWAARADVPLEASQ